MHRCAGGSEALQNVALGHSMYLPANRFPVEQNCPGCHTSGYREINRPLDFVCLGQMRRGLKRSVPPKLDFASSQTILFVLTSSETIRNSRNTALLSVFAYISWKRRLKPIFMSTCFFLSRDSITPQKWISSAAWPPASRFIIHSESYRTLQNCTPCRVEDVFMSNTSR